MATQYRTTRNIEASILQFLQEQIDLAWTGVSVEKSFARIYEISLPAVCVKCKDIDHDRAEIGSESTIRTAQILINVFGSSEGLKLDLVDYIVGKIKSGIPYYEYTISAGTIQNKVQNGRLRVTNLDVTSINFDIDRNTLSPHDRYRALITITISTGKVEN